MSFISTRRTPFNISCRAGLLTSSKLLQLLFGDVLISPSFLKTNFIEFLTDSFIFFQHCVISLWSGFHSFQWKISCSSYWGSVLWDELLLSCCFQIFLFVNLIIMCLGVDLSVDDWPFYGPFFFLSFFFFFFLDIYLFIWLHQVLVVVWGLNCPEACGILLDQGLNLRHLRCKVSPLLGHQGSPIAQFF